MATQPTPSSELRRRATAMREEARDWRRKAEHYMGSTRTLVLQAADDSIACAEKYERLAEQQESLAKPGEGR